MVYEKKNETDFFQWLGNTSEPGTYNIEVDIGAMVVSGQQTALNYINDMINGKLDAETGAITAGSFCDKIISLINPGVFLNLKLTFNQVLNIDNAPTLNAVIFGTPEKAITFLKSLEIDMSKTPLLKSTFLVGFINDAVDINLNLSKIDCNGSGFFAPVYMCKSKNVTNSFKSYENVGSHGDIMLGINDVTENYIFKGPNVIEDTTPMLMSLADTKIVIGTLDLSPFKSIPHPELFSPILSSKIEVRNIIFGPKTKFTNSSGTLCSMFYESKELNTVKIPGIVIDEGGSQGPLYHAFSGCSNLTEVTISKSFVDWAEAHQYDHNAVFSNATSFSTFYVTDATEEELPTLKQKIVAANTMLDIPNVEGITVKLVPKPAPKERTIYTFVRIA